MSVQFDIDASFEVIRSPDGAVRLRFITMAGEGSFTVPLTEESRRWLLLELSRCAPPEDERLDALDVFCPVCGGRPGVVCRDCSGSVTSHIEREGLARLVNQCETSGEPDPVRDVARCEHPLERRRQLRASSWCAACGSVASSEQGGATCTGRLVHDEFTMCPLHDASRSG